MKVPLLTIAAVFALTLALLAQGTASSTEEFVTKAGVANAFEMDSSRMAVEKAQDPEVKEFAEKLITDHEKAGEELLSTVDQTRINTPVPEGVDAKHKDMIEKLEAASGAEFDQLYVDMQVQAHEEAVELFRSYAENGDQPQLKEFASSNLPALEEHLEMAKELDQGS